MIHHKNLVKASRILGACALLLALALSFSACRGQEPKNVGNQSTPSYQVNTDQAAALGDLAESGIEISIAPGTFDDDKTEVAFRIREDAPAVGQDFALGLGAPFEIAISQGLKRLNEPLAITLKLSEEDLANLRYEDDLKIGYYNGAGWEYFTPLEVNLTEGHVRFETFHCSFFSKVKPTTAEINDTLAYEYAKTAYASGNGASKQATKDFVLSVMSNANYAPEGAFVDDVVEALIANNKFGELLTHISKGNIKDATYEAIGLVSAEAKLIAKASAATAQLDREKLNQVFESALIDSNMLTKNIAAVARITQRQINRWKSSEIEAAYQVFVNGGEVKRNLFWGYDVDAGDFDAIWNQMRGVSERICIDAINDYAEMRGISVDDLTAKQKAIIREQARQALKAEFEERKSSEARIKELHDENNRLLAYLYAHDMLTEPYHGFEKMSYEQRVRMLLALKNRILSDTGRKLNTDKDAINSNSRMTLNTLLWLMMEYTDKGEDAYRKKLIELGYAEEEKQAAAYWELTNILDYPVDNESDEYYAHEYSYGRGTYTHVTTLIGHKMSHPGGFHKGYCTGEYVRATGSVEAPPERIYGDEELVLHVAIAVETSEPICYGLLTSVGVGIQPLNAEDPFGNYGGSISFYDIREKLTKSFLFTPTDAGYESYSADMGATMPSGYEDGDKIYIVSGCEGMKTAYEYTWHNGQ